MGLKIPRKTEKRQFRPIISFYALFQQLYLFYCCCILYIFIAYLKTLQLAALKFCFVLKPHASWFVLIDCTFAVRGFVSVTYTICLNTHKWIKHFGLITINMVYSKVFLVVFLIIHVGVFAKNYV